MTLKSVMLQLEVDQIVELDRSARRTGVSRSQLVRDAVDALLDPPDDADVAAQYARAYPVRADGQDDWGDLDAWHVAARAARVEAERDRPTSGVRGEW